MHNGTSSMLGKDSRVVKQANKEFKIARSSYCVRCSLSLSVKLADSTSKVMKDCIGTHAEITKLIKFSPKRENILENMKMADMIIAKSYEDFADENAKNNAPLHLKNFHKQDRLQTM